MNRRFASLALSLVVVFAACGGDDDVVDPPDPSATEAPVPDSPATTAAPQTPEPTTPPATDPPPATEAPAPVTTMAELSGPDAFIAGIADYVGSYEGAWNNTTFGSTGSIAVNILEPNLEAGFVILQIDLGGNVFGLADPDMVVVEISTFSGGLEVGSSGIMNNATFEVDEDGNFTLTAMPGDLDGLSIVIQGSIVEGGFEGTYTIEGLAEGTWNAAAIP